MIMREKIGRLRGSEEEEEEGSERGGLGFLKFGVFGAVLGHTSGGNEKKMTHGYGYGLERGGRVWSGEGDRRDSYSPKTERT